jgi:DNA-binding response OmpR family regulator
MASLGSVLLVDDEETFRESTRRLLHREGFDCYCAGNGNEAGKALHDRRFDLMIADICMPGNPDLSVVRAARELDSQIPVVLVTGYPSAETAIRGIGLSVAAYMTKPLDFEELLGHVKSAVGSSRHRRALAAVRARLQTCLAELEADQRPRVEGKEEPVSIGTIRTLAACLSELLRLRRSGGDGQRGNLCELLDCPQEPVHCRAILQTIEVLKRTKDTFKSKVLADLRMKLEGLFGPEE